MEDKTMKRYEAECHVCHKIHFFEACFAAGSMIRGADGKERQMRSCGAHKPEEVREAWLKRGAPTI